MSTEHTTIPTFNPSGSTVVDGIKSRIEELLKFLEENVPANRCRSIAMTNLEQGSMWAVKANFS